MLRIDRAGQGSKRYAGASQSPLTSGDTRCPMWGVHEAFSRPGEVVADLVELEDGSRWFTQSRSVAAPGATGSGTPARFAVRSEERTSELQSLMRNSYAVFCLKNKKIENLNMLT